jgi:GNAT superfamily N-acetyltransferase
LSREVEVVRTYLELRSPEQLRPVDATDSSVAFVHRPSIRVSEYRRLYEAVGYRWYWRDRNAWSDERLAAHLARPEISVWECLVDGKRAGYFELERRDDGSVEVAYFGLTEGFTGRGVGKAMLTRAAREAWALGPNRVWLHTCTLDSPYALPNYEARGFTRFRTETYLAHVDD